MFKASILRLKLFSTELNKSRFPLPLNFAFFIRALTILVALNFAAGVYSQDVTDEKEIRIDTALVEVPLIVTTKDGRPLTGLKKENFLLFEDGKQQEIANFSTTSEPFEVVLLLDTSGSTFAELSKIRRAAKEFIDRLRAGDKVALIAFSASNTGRSSDTFSIILSPLTSDRSALYQALERLTTSYGTPYYDSLLKVTEEVFNKPAERQFKGRRALVAMTDGVDSTSKSDFDLASEQILRAGLSVYFLRIDSRDYFEENLLGDCTVAKHFSDSQLKRFYDSFGKGSRIERKTNFCQLGDFERLEISKRLYEIADNEMERLAAASGGKVFEAGTDSEVLRAFGQIAQEIGSRYAIGYYSNNTAQDGSYRKITVKGRNLPAGAIIRAREGYIAPKSQ